MNIQSQKIDIHQMTKIAPDAEIIASDSIEIGKYVVINSGFKVRCRSLWIGYHTYIGEGVGIGGGGCNGINSHVKIGYRSLIAEKSFINCAESVTIGEHVAFGYGTQVWTHGVWQPVEQGFNKMKQEPVVIGDEVWLPSRCQVLPGVTIGDNVVVGMGSLVNRDLPSGCVAVGRPAVPIKEEVYPDPISDDHLRDELNRICNHYMILAHDKGYFPDVVINDHCLIEFSHDREAVVFDPREKTFSPCPDISVYAEDFRDFLRRWGFPFYGGGFFESIEPLRFKKARERE